MSRTARYKYVALKPVIKGIPRFKNFELASESQEVVVAGRCRLQALPRLRFGLGTQPGADLLGRQLEPRRIEQLQVVGVERDVVAARERVVREKHVERASAIEHLHLRNDGRERYVVAVVPVDAVQACRAARLVVRLRLDGKTERRLNGDAAGVAVVAMTASA